MKLPIHPLAVLKIIVLGFALLPAAVSGAIRDLQGHYVGAWTNQTFGSTGKAVININWSGTNAALVFDMDGFVFGQVDPPVISMPGTVQGNTIVIDNQGVGIFGDIKGLVDADAGTLTSTLTNVPGGYILDVTVTGTITNDVISLGYTVDFNQPPSATNPAHGVMQAALVPAIAITQSERQGSSLMLQWSGGMPPYGVQTRTNLTLGSWTDTGISTSNNTAAVSISASGNAFFRVTGQ